MQCFPVLPSMKICTEQMLVLVCMKLHNLVDTQLVKCFKH